MLVSNLIRTSPRNRPDRPTGASVASSPSPPEGAARRRAHPIERGSAAPTPRHWLARSDAEALARPPVCLAHPSVHESGRQSRCGPRRGRCPQRQRDHVSPRPGRLRAHPRPPARCDRRRTRPGCCSGQGRVQPAWAAGVQDPGRVAGGRTRAPREARRANFDRRQRGEPRPRGRPRRRAARAPRQIVASSFAPTTARPAEVTTSPARDERVQRSRPASWDVLNWVGSAATCITS